MPGTRELKRRIKSVGSTKKITRAMQMVSAAKMRKAQVAVLASRSYSDLAWQIVKNLSSKVDPKYHRLLANGNGHGKKKTGIILISSNRGFIGGFNANLTAAVKKFIAQDGGAEEEVLADIIAVGKKGREAMVKVGNTVFAEFEKVERTIRLQEIFPISKLIADEYINGNYGKIVIAYTHFVSTISQKPVIKQLLPLQPSEHEDLPEHFRKGNYKYLFEPDPERVLDYLLPRILESQIYQAVLESDAAEHSSRMIMMKNATDSATDLISDLTLTYNQLRQANITKELAEITAGRIALE